MVADVVSIAPVDSIEVLVNGDVVHTVRATDPLRASSDVAFLADTVRGIWTRVEKSRWRSDAERDAFKAAVDRALAVYQRLAADAR